MQPLAYCTEITPQQKIVEIAQGKRGKRTENTQKTTNKQKRNKQQQQRNKTTNTPSTPNLRIRTLVTRFFVDETTTCNYVPLYRDRLSSALRLWLLDSHWVQPKQLRCYSM